MRKNRRRRHGSIMIMVLLMLTVFISAAAMAVDVAYIQLVQTQLRSAADATALAGAESLAEGKTRSQVRADMQAIAQLNLVAGRGLQLDPADIVFGRSMLNGNGTYSFEVGAVPTNGVRVEGRRTASSSNGSVSTLLGGLMGVTDFQPTKSATATLEERDIVIVVDRSGSMGRRDAVHPVTGETISRLDALKGAVQMFRQVIDMTPGEEQLALVSYSSDVRVDSNLSSNYAAFDVALNALQPSGYTAIGRGVDQGGTSLKHLNRRLNATPVIIVMTDGRHNTGTDPEAEAQNAKDDDDLAGLVIHALTFSSGADRARMQRVADIGDGTYLHADDAADLQARFEELARTAGGILIQ